MIATFNQASADIPLAAPLSYRTPSDPPADSPSTGTGTNTGVGTGTGTSTGTGTTTTGTGTTTTGTTTTGTTRTGSGTSSGGRVRRRPHRLRRRRSRAQHHHLPRLLAPVHTRPRCPSRRSLFLPKKVVCPRKPKRFTIPLPNPRFTSSVIPQRRTSRSRLRTPLLPRNQRTWWIWPWRMFTSTFAARLRERKPNAAKPQAKEEQERRPPVGWGWKRPHLRESAVKTLPRFLSPSLPA